jgi:hypothetical protein
MTMEPEREYDLVDLVDRLLNKGLILNADLIITVAGVPMIGLNLKAALASIETMLDYGMMEAWDKSTREWYEKERMATDAMLLLEGEKVLLRVPGSLLSGNGDFSVWKPGFWHMTDRRLFLRCGTEISFEIPLPAIETMKPEVEESGRKERRVLVLGCEGGEYLISVRDPDELKVAVEDACARRNELVRPAEAVHPL